MIYLQDFTSINVNLNADGGLVVVGREILSKLIELKNDKNIVGVYFTHYSQTEPPHIHIGFRYINWKEIESKLTPFFDKSTYRTNDFIRDIQKCPPTDGKHHLLPYDKGVISDYLVCQSFDWLLQLEKEIPESERDAERIAYWFLKNKNKIFAEVVKIYNSEFNEQEIFWVLERFVHHLLNTIQHNPSNELWILTYLSGSGFFKE